MPYTLSEIRVHAFNFTPQEDYSIPETNLFTGLAYCYERWRNHPEEFTECRELAGRYLKWYGDRPVLL